MPTGYLSNDLPGANIRNTDLPTGYARFSAILTPGRDVLVLAGTPIGLLLSLTYAVSQVLSTTATFKGESPTARIRNTD